MITNGWIPKTAKVWTGNGNNTIKVKSSKGGFRIMCEVGNMHESAREPTLEDALKMVEWFANRRPQ